MAVGRFDDASCGVTSPTGGCRVTYYNITTQSAHTYYNYMIIRFAKIPTYYNIITHSTQFAPVIVYGFANTPTYGENTKKVDISRTTK